MKLQFSKNITMLFFFITLSFSCKNGETTAVIPETPKPDILAYSILMFDGMNHMFTPFTINSDGTNNKKLINSTVPLGKPVWSPDASKFLANGFLSTTISIHVFNADGTNLKRLTTLDNVNDANWSPDGSKITFTKIIPGQNYRFEVWVMSSDGSDPRFVVEGKYPKWAPNGNSLIYSSQISGNFEIYTCNAYGTNQKKLTSTSENETEPEFSPDGKKIVYRSFTGDGTNRASEESMEIYSMNSDGSGAIKLTTNNSIDMSPTWSPDGTKIAFISDRHAPNRSEVYVMNADGTNAKRVTVTTNPNETATDPSWKPKK